jgi:hypothetical protein
MDENSLFRIFCGHQKPKSSIEVVVVTWRSGIGRKAMGRHHTWYTVVVVRRCFHHNLSHLRSSSELLLASASH